jgi:general secretion pathway protein J
MSREAGFTLLEILVAMVVLSLIVSSAFGALRMGERSWEAGLKRSGETETLRTVSGVLQRQFGQVLPLTWTEGTQRTIAFSGAREKLRFIAPAPLHQGSTGLFEYTLVVEADADSSQLVLYYRLHDPDTSEFQPEGSDRQRVLLVEDMTTASFDYYGSPISGDPPQWQSQWNSDAEEFPQLVRARLATDAGPWPELVLALHTVTAK